MSDLSERPCSGSADQGDRPAIGVEGYPAAQSSRIAETRHGIPNPDTAVADAAEAAIAESACHGDSARGARAGRPGDGDAGVGDGAGGKGSTRSDLGEGIISHAGAGVHVDQVDFSDIDKAVLDGVPVEAAVTDHAEGRSKSSAGDIEIAAAGISKIDIPVDIPVDG